MVRREGRGGERGKEGEGERTLVKVRWDKMREGEGWSMTRQIVECNVRQRIGIG